MITYKDTLKLKLEKLQKAIDDISNINYGNLRIGGGVIVDMTVDNINANSITTNILKVNNDINLKNLSVDDLSVVNTITTKNENITENLYLKNGNAYVKLWFYGGNLCIDENVDLSNNKFFYQNNKTFLYDRNGYVYFCKGTLSSGTTYKPRTYYKFICDVFGFFDASTNIAVLSTSFTQCYFANAEYNDYYFFIGFLVNNIPFGTVSMNLSSPINTNWNNTLNDYYRTRIAGNTECSKISTSISANALSTGDRYYHSLFPCNFTIEINNTLYNCYVLRDRSSQILSSTDAYLMFKFTDVICNIADSLP